MKWIKTIDKLPKEEQTLNIYFKNSVGWHVGSCYWDGTNFIDLCEVCGHNEAYKPSALVTHWQPLPEKPSDG